MMQRVRIPHRGQSPSSVTQLPILTALHARLPTLFGLIIHHLLINVNTFFEIPFFGVFYRAFSENGKDKTKKGGKNPALIRCALYGKPQGYSAASTC